MTTTAFDDQFTDAPEPVRQTYDTGSILRRNVADLEIALRKQTERAEAAEAELAKAREQKPAGYVLGDWRGATTISAVKSSHFNTPLYAAPVPSPAVPDANPVQWLADEGDMILVPRGLLGAACSSIDKQRPAPKVLEALRYYTMNAPQAPAVPSGWNIRRDGDVLIVRHPDIGGCSVQKEPDWERMIPEAILYSLADALLQSAPQAPAVPELDPMNRLIVSDPKQPKSPQQATSVPKEWRDYVFAAADELRLTARDLKNGFVRCGNCGEQETTSDLDCVSDIDGALELLDGLLQSAPATVAVTAEWREVISDLLANDGADGGRYDASKWLAARDKARALLQSAEVHHD